MKGGVFGRGTSAFVLRSRFPVSVSSRSTILTFQPASQADTAALLDDVHLDGPAFDPLPPVEPAALPAALDAVDFARVAGVVVPAENETVFRGVKSAGAGLTRSVAGRLQDRRRNTKRAARLSTIVKDLVEGEAFANLFEGFAHAARFDDGTMETSSGVFPEFSTTCWIDPVGGRFGTGCLVVPAGVQAQYNIDAPGDWTMFSVLFDTVNGVWRTHVVRSDGLRLFDGDIPDDSLGYVPFLLSTAFTTTTVAFFFVGHRIDSSLAATVTDELRVDEFCVFPWLMPETMVADLLDNVPEDKVSPFPLLRVGGRILDGGVGLFAEGSSVDGEFVQRGGQEQGWQNNGVRITADLVEVERVDSVDDVPLPTLYAPLSVTTRAGADTFDVAGGRTGVITGNFSDVLGFDDVEDNALQCQGDAGDAVDFGDDGVFEGDTAASDDAMSFACWICPTSNPVTGAIASKWRRGTNERAWLFEVVNSLPFVTFSDGGGANSITVGFNVSLTVGVWTFLAFTYRRDTVNRSASDFVRTWGPGGLRTTFPNFSSVGAFVGTSANTARQRLFNIHDGSSPLAATMQHAALWSGLELSAAEIRTVYRATRLGRRLRRV